MIQLKFCVGIASIIVTNRSSTTTTTDVAVHASIELPLSIVQHSTSRLGLGRPNETSLLSAEWFHNAYIFAQFCDLFLSIS